MSKLDYGAPAAEADVAGRAQLVERLAAGTARVVVVGLGYVGLPLAVGLAEAGHQVTGVDLDAHRVGEVNAGHSYIEDIAVDRVQALVAIGRLSAGTGFSSVADADAVVIAVPTPIDVHRVPDLRFVREASESVAGVVRVGALVSLESTSYPGTTDEILVAALQRRGLVPGRDIFVAYSPERIDPANPTWNLRNAPKLVAGVTPACQEVALALYGRMCEVPVPVSDIRTAELAKLFENIFRVVNIALVNELQVICDGFGIDVWDVIAACSTKPFGFMPFYPGPGLGGHCVPVDPFYLAWKARERHITTEFIELAGKINAAMPAYIVHKVASRLNENGKALRGARIGVLGVAYKKNTSDTRESPAIPILEQMLAEGALVTYHDPHVAAIALVAGELRSTTFDADYLGRQDVVVVLADHDDIDWQLVKHRSRLLVDTRNVTRRV